MPSFLCMPFMACNRQIDSLDRRQGNLEHVPNEIERHARTLEELLLDMNKIKELPKSLFKLHKLRRLGLSDNEIHRLPPEVSSLVSLVELNLSRNDITDVPEELKECKLLMYLDLSSNAITRLPTTITQLTQLTHLRINDVSLTHLPQDIGQLVNLRSLELRENLVRSIPASLAQLVNLEFLDLGQNELEQLPVNMSGLRSLMELYVDNNDLEALPEEITRCTNLEQIDVSDNRLMVLPEDLGDLDKMTDMNFSNNCLQVFPSSIGRLKKLTILKADRNVLCSLTQSIGSCTALEELMLTHNNLTELPSSIGNLTKMKCLNVDQNSLTAIPSTIGCCSSLSILSLRDNKISELPMDIGKCERLTVLDLCSNRLSFLPFTINVLYKLHALWLSENQSQAMLKLQQERDPHTGVKVLTCYLLPQQSAQQTDPEKTTNRNFIGGPKVHFNDADNTHDEERNLPVGQFERHDTPHPKPHAAKLKKQTIDGHIIHHDDEQAQPSALVLSKKASVDASTPQQTPPNPSQPRSALRYQSVPVQQYVPESSSTSNLLAVASTEQSGTHASKLHASNSQLPQQTGNISSYDRSVAFANSEESDTSHATKLKRVNTPHYNKNHPRPAAHAQQQREMDRSSSSIRVPGEAQVVRLVVRRDEQGGLGMSIAGGLESTPYREGDNGLFISRVTPGGPAERAGLRQGDKLVRVNDSDVVNVRHEAAVHKMQESRGQLELTVLRIPEESPSLAASFRSPNQSLDMSFMSDVTEMSSLNHETITTTLKRDASGSPGFSVAGGTGTGRDRIYVSQITPGGSADRDGKLSVGDRVILINGTSMKGARHDQAVALLTGHADNEVYLVVQRERPSLTSPMPMQTSAANTPTTPLNSSLVAPSPQPANVSLIRSPSRSAPLNLLGDTSSWDGITEEVELNKDGTSLGLSIVGGSDHSSHPFGVRHPGVFISKITVNSPAARCGHLRIGDRILSVNDKDVRNSKHIEAVEALKKSGARIKLKVIHEPQPAGLTETTLHRKDGQPLGINIHGGVRAPSANPRDSTDEGIFIDKVEPGSVCAFAGLIAGQRIIEVNGESLLGCTQAEAAEALRRSPELRLLVCDGYNTPAAISPAYVVPQQRSRDLPTDENTCARAESPELSPLPPRSLSPLSNASPVIRALQDGPPLATSSPLPPQTTQKQPIKVPPPVAPKPTLKTSQAENIQASPIETAQPERLNFSSKLQKFEREIETKRADKISHSSLPPPEKKPLLSQQDMNKLKEEESKKLIQADLLDSPDKDAKDAKLYFDQFLPERTVESNGTGAPPIAIRSKRAEQRAIAAGQIIPVQPANDVEARALEQQQRREWREARWKSLDQQREEADAIMKKLQIGSLTLSSISEDRSSPLNEKILANETSVERHEHMDPITGEKGFTIVEKSLTKREFELSGAEIGFADD